MPDSVQPIRHAPVSAPASRKGGRDKRPPFTLADEPPPEPEALDDPADSADSARYSERDIGQKPDDEEGATLDVTG